MNIVKSLFLFYLITLISCTTQKNTVDDSQVKTDKLNQYIMTLSGKVDSLENVIEEERAKALLYDHDSLLFSLKRTPCLGTCPVYNIEIYKDGFVRYKGKNHVDRIGESVGSIDSDQITKVNLIFEKATFYSFNDEYTDSRLDIPSTVIEYYSDNGGYKKVVASTDIPREFRVLVSELELLIENVNWE